MKTDNCSIRFDNVSLVYDLYYDKTTTLKEYVVNSLTRRKYSDPSEKKLYALRDVSLDIEHGERLGVIGLNGSGKSTFLKIIAGLLRPTEGRVLIEGTVQPLIEVGAGFNPEFSGRDNIYLNGAMLGFSKKQIAEKERDIIEFAELGSFIDVPVKYYSSGMAMRLAFTIATLIEPEILVMDEMLSAGDLEFIQKASNRMDQIVSSAKLLVIVSHDLSLIRSLARRVIVLHKGDMVYDGETDAAIDFYTDLISDKIEKKKEEQRLLEEKRQALDPEPPGDREPELISVGNGRLSNETRAGNENWPEDRLRFGIDFETTETFDNFYINLVITDKAGVTLGHLRNDFADIELNDFKAGPYSVEIPVLEIPFKSGRYRYYFRFVGVKDKKNFIKDSEPGEFTLLGNKKQHRLIRHEWIIKDRSALAEPIERKSV